MRRAAPIPSSDRVTTARSTRTRRSVSARTSPRSACGSTAARCSRRNQIFIAEHGSWDRSQPIGYRVVVARPGEHGEKRLQNFAEGWLQPNGKAWGRPVDVLVAPDGALLVSDDQAGAVYRITYEQK